MVFSQNNMVYQKSYKFKGFGGGPFKWIHVTHAKDSGLAIFSAFLAKTKLVLSAGRYLNYISRAEIITARMVHEKWDWQIGTQLSNHGRCGNELQRSLGCI